MRLRYGEFGLRERKFGLRQRAVGVGPQERCRIAKPDARLGAAGGRISGKRAALREALASELKANRRLGALMRAEGRIVRDLLRSIYGDEVEQALDGAGNLVDAEA